MTPNQGNQDRWTRSPLRPSSSLLAAVAVASLVVGLLGVALTYLALQRPEPSIALETVGETNVLDVRRPLQDLSIVFRGQDVQEQNLNLRILTIRIANVGDVDILSGHYDRDDDWGIQFDDGKVIEARLVDTNSDYLQSKVIPEPKGTNSVIFPKVIFEQDDFFVVEVLLLHSKDNSPSFSSMGKIAGIDKVSVLPRLSATQDENFFEDLFRGSVLIQLVRTVIYFVGVLLLMVVVLVSLVLIGGLVGNLGNRRRKKRISQTQAIRELEREPVKEFFISRYGSGGMTWLKWLLEIARDPGNIEWVVPTGQWISRAQDGPLDEFPPPDDVDDLDVMRFHYFDTLDSMTRIGVLERGEGDIAVIDSGFTETVCKLVSELER